MNDKIGSRACARLLPNRFGLLLSLTFFAASGLAAQQANGQVTPAPRAADSPRWQTASPETVSPWKTASDKVWTSKSAERYERRKDARGQRAGFEGRRSLEGRQGRGERRPVPLDAELIAKHADDCEWSDEFAQPGFDGPVFAIEMFDDGGGMALYAGGDFSSASGVAAESIAKWDGTTWAPLGLGILGDVYSMAVFDDGTGEALYVGGYFSVAGGVPAENIAKWDGTSWSALGLGTDDTVDALTVFDDGGGEDLYAGGYFNTAGGVAADYIAQWDGTTWSAVGLGTSGPVYDLLPFDDGGGTVLFAGGDFEFAGGVSVFGIAKWDGATWADLDEGVSGPVEALAVFDDGGGEDLYVGGFFAFAGPFPGVDVYGIARWDGIGWSDLDMGVDSIFEPPVVLSLAVFDDGGGEDLYVGGTFDIAGPAVLVSNIARWDGTAWSDVGLGTDSTVWALKAFDDGSGTDLFAGGEFFGAGTGPAPSLARWDGTAWSAVDSAGVTLAGLNGPVLALTTFDDGGGEDLYAGGFFIAAGSVPAIAVARWDGADWAALGSGLTCEIRGGPPGMLVAPAPADSDPATNKGIIIPEPCFPEVHAFAVYDDGSGPALYVAGVFDRAGGLPAANIAKWDGTTWSALGMGVEGRIEALAVYDDGSGAQLYAGGSFDTAGGAPADNIASWDGTTWSALGLGVDSDVEALGVFDGDLYAGGEFSTAGGAPANYIASWDGTTWSTLGTGTDDEVEAFGVFDDGTGAALYVGGNFSFAGGVLVDYIARWDGAAWSAVGGGMDDEVESFQVYDDGSGPALYAGGFFTIAGGVAASRIARWDGTDWEPLGLGIDDPFYAPSVETMTVWDKGDGPSLFAGGFFLLAGGMPSSFIAEWSCPVLDYGDAPDPTYPTLFASDGARHQVVSGFYLGSTADVELDGQLSADALGDDTTGTDDEDGVTFNNGLVPDASTAVDVVASAAGELDAWIDWNADGMWDAGEKIFDGEDLAAGTNSLSFSVPASATVGPTYARFRLSSAGVATPDGRAPDGEVEDYAVTISAPAEISISNVTLDEGDASMTAFAFVVSRSHNLSAASVDFATADGTASAGSDYAALALQTLSFTAGGSLSQMVTVQVTGDTTVEDDETFTVNLSSPVAATVSDGTGIGTIDNDDSTELSISSQDQAEAAGAMTFTVSLSNPVDVAISVDVSTTDGTATTGDSDYAGLSGQTVNLAANTTSAMFDVTVNDDSTVEADETFTTSLSNLVAGGRDVTLASGGTGTIENDDSAELSLSSVSQAEAAGAMTFAVSLSNPVDAPISVDVSTTDGTATAADSDFVGLSGQTVNFAANITSAMFDVTVNDDSTVEADEIFTTSLSNLVAGGRDVTLGSGGTGTIENDDAAVLSLSSVAQPEGAGDMTFTATLSNPVDLAISADVSTADGSATVADNDYVAVVSQTLNLAASVLSADFVVTINDDSKLEADETFTTALANLVAGGRDVSLGAGGTGTIENDDTVSLTIDDVAQTEGTGGSTDFVFTVTLSDLSALPVTVDYATADGSAEDESGDGDYQSTSGTLTFDPKVTSQSISVTVTADATEELPIEDFFVDLSNPTVATIADDQGLGEIADDDDQGPPAVTLVDTVGGTGNGELTECEEVRTTVTAVRVTFDQAVRDPDGDSEADDVTNPDNYRLIVAGDDSDLGTDVCGAPVGDDEVLDIASVSYDPGTFTAEIAPLQSLPDSAQRFLVCSSILDLAGNPLGGGSDFNRTFRVERRNHFVNGQIDCDLAGWTGVSTIPEEIAYDVRDVDDASISGSAAVSNLTASTDFSFGQCMNLDGGFNYVLAASVQLSADPAASIFLNRACEFFAAADCAGTPLTATLELFPIEDTAGAWQEVASEVAAPDTANSALCSFDLQAPTGDAFDAYLDDLELSQIEQPIFTDGFESGDTSAWSFSTP